MEIKGKSKIAGIGAFLPQQRVLSDDLMAESRCSRFGTSESYISKRIGIIERRIADEITNPSDMAILASEEALKDARLNPLDIDLIIYCGIDKDWQEPATAHRVQVEIGASRASCFDVSNACHGFMTGISIADSFIQQGAANRVLVCTGEKPSTVLNYTLEKLKTEKDRTEFRKMLGALTVGDAGGAMVIEKTTDNTGLRWMQSYSAGEYADLCYYKHSQEGYEGQMLMTEISLAITDLHKRLMDSTYQKLSWQPSDVDKMYCHQVGKKPHKALVNIAQKNLEEAPATYPYFGNLTSATIPVNMFLNKPQRGDHLLIMGTGSGLSVCQAGMVF